ncbi:MAG: hypothetical protein K0Q94_5409 [Paenibacillus sp.]|nr:hypothetical protein [Paenibacillus sp.]
MKLDKKRESAPSARTSAVPRREGDRSAISAARSFDTWHTAQQTMGNRAVGRLIEHTISRKREEPGRLGTEAPFVQRLIDASGFKAETKVKNRFRMKIKGVDEALADYGKIGRGDFAGRNDQLDVIRDACNGYKAHPKAHPHRVAGVDRLLVQIGKERRVLAPLAEAMAEADPKKKFAKLCEGQDALVEVKEAVPGLGNMTLDPEFSECIREIRAVPGAMEELLQNEMDQLRAIMNDADTPDITKQILAEALANADQIHLEAFSPGARFTNQKEKDRGIAEKYVVNHNMNAPGGTSERLGSLAHELTHVSISEQFDNTALFFAFGKDASEDEVMNLVEKRRSDLDALIALLDPKDFTKEQTGLLNSKLAYPRKGGPAGVQRYIDNFYTSKKITKEQKEKAESLVARGMDNTVIEFDTVMNQMLIYMQQWKIPQDNAFYAKLMEVATEAQAHRMGG